MSFQALDLSGHAGSALYLAEPFRPHVASTTILIVDRDPAVRDALSLTLRASGFRVDSCGSPRDVLAKASIEETGCLLIEYDLDDMTGVELLVRLNARRIIRPAVIMSARLRPLVFEGSWPPGMIVTLQKPFGQEALLKCLRQALAGSAP